MGHIVCNLIWHKESAGSVMLRVHVNKKYATLPLVRNNN